MGLFVFLGRYKVLEAHVGMQAGGGLAVLIWCLGFRNALEIRVLKGYFVEFV